MELKWWSSVRWFSQIWLSKISKWKSRNIHLYWWLAIGTTGFFSIFQRCISREHPIRSKWWHVPRTCLNTPKLFFKMLPNQNLNLNVMNFSSNFGWRLESDQKFYFFKIWLWENLTYENTNVLPFLQITMKFAPPKKLSMVAM